MGKKFPFLIGRIRTHLIYQSEHFLKLSFPFLIGRIRTIFHNNYMDMYFGFPFLIGRIRTKDWKEPLIHAVALFPFLIGRIRTILKNLSSRIRQKLSFHSS